MVFNRASVLLLTRSPWKGHMMLRYHGNPFHIYGVMCVEAPGQLDSPQHTDRYVYVWRFLRYALQQIHWNGNVVILTKSLALAAPEVVHDDVIKWKHFPRYWPFVGGIHRSPVYSPHKGQWRGTLMFSLICDWINGRINNREAGDIKRHQTHYDVIVMQYDNFQCSKWRKYHQNDISVSVNGTRVRYRETDEVKWFCVSKSLDTMGWITWIITVTPYWAQWRLKSSGVSVVYSSVCSGADQRKHQSSFVREIHWWPADSPHKGPVMRKMFPFDDVIMMTSYEELWKDEIIFSYVSQTPHLHSKNMFLINPFTNTSWATLYKHVLPLLMSLAFIKMWIKRWSKGAGKGTA